MPISKDFELVFEGPADESAETLRKLRTSLLADLGLSVTEAQEVLCNTPKTLKTSQLEDDLKPLYAALRKAGAKVLIVRPAEATNDKAYFLDLEDSKLDDDLLKSLEALPGEEETVHEIEDVDVDLTQELEALTEAENKATEKVETPAPEAKVEAPVEVASIVQETTSSVVEPIPEVSVALPPEITVAPIISEIAAVSPAAPAGEPIEAKPEQSALELTLTLDEPVVAKSVSGPEVPKNEDKLAEIPAPIAAAPEIPKTITPIGDKPLFEFSSPSEPEPIKPAIEVTSTADLKASKPLFEFNDVSAALGSEPVAANPVPAMEAKREIPPVIAATPEKPSIFDDLSLSLDDPEVEIATKAQVKVREAKSEKSSAALLKEEAAFSSDALSSSLTSQLVTEKDAAPKPKATPAPASLNLAVEGAAPPPLTPKAKAPEVSASPPHAPKPVNPNIVIEPEGAAKAAAEASVPKIDEPPPVAFKSSAMKEQMSLDLLLPILVGAVLLGIANWFYFQPDGAEINLPKINFSDTAEESDENITRREVIPSTEKRVTGKTQQGELAIAWTVVFDKEVLKSVSIEASTPQPPDLTPEQIVRAERPPPWLYKIEVAQFPFEKHLDGTWQAKGPARVFVNQGASKRRLVAQAEITLDSFKPGESVVGRFSIMRGYPNPPPAEKFHFEQLINGDIMLFAASELK